MMTKGISKTGKAKDVRNKDLFYAILINLVIFIVLQIIFKPMYETNDDNYISSLVYGAFGEYDTHLVYTNILMGKVYKVLLLLSPSIPWYAIIQYSLLFVSFTAILYIVLSYKENIYCYIFCWIFMIPFGYECYVNVQYSKTAGVVVTAGVLLVYTAIKKEKIKKFMLILGIILTICASLYRFKVFCMMLPIVGSIILVDCLKEVLQKKYQLLLKCCIVFIPVFALCMLGELYDVKHYDNNQAWHEYREWDNLRIQLLDYGFPDYDENREVYQNLNISYEDMQLFKHWNYADTEIFTPEAMKQLIAVKQRQKVNMDLVRGFFTEDILQFVAYPYVIVLIMLIAFWILSGAENKLLISMASIFFLLMQFYFYYTDRFLINRVDMSLILGLCLVFMFNIKESHHEGIKFCVIGGLTGVAFIMAFQLIGDLEEPKVKKEEYAKEIYNLIASDKEHLYMIENNTSDSLWTSAFQIWDVVPKGISDNYLVLGGWRYPTPPVKKIMSKYHVSNPYKDLVNDGRYYLVCSKESSEDILTYIQRHYSSNAKIHVIKYINGQSFYKIRTGKLKLNMDNVSTNLKEIKSEILKKNVVSQKKEKQTWISGYIYKKNSNSFAQNIYLGVKNKKTGKEKIYSCTQYEKSYKDNVNNGKYSWFSAKIAGDINENKQENEVSIYLSADGVLYKQKIDLTEE